MFEIGADSGRYYSLNVPLREGIDDPSRFYFEYSMNRKTRKPSICSCENKDTDQLCGNCTAYQCLSFHYIDSTIPLLPNFEIASFWSVSVTVQADLCDLVEYPDYYSPALKKWGYTGFTLSFRSSVLLLFCPSGISFPFNILRMA